jgi:hypothetical protein
MIRKTLGCSFYLLLGILCLAPGIRAGTGEPKIPTILRHYPASGAAQVPGVTNIGITATQSFDESVTSPRQWIVTGSRSGVHAGAIVFSDDRRTAIFKPSLPFGNADTVSVSLNSISEDGAPLQCSFGFVTCIRTLTLSSMSAQALRGPVSNSLHLDSLPPPPPPNQWGLVTTVDSNPTPGRIFLSIIPGQEPPYGLMITDENSNALLSLPIQANDYVLQPNGLTTCFNPRLASGAYCAIDSLGSVLQTYACANGVTPDGHELILRKDGGYTLLGLSLTTQDMSAFQGSLSATIQGGVIETFDASGNCIFEWRGIDSGHYQVQDDIEPGDLTGTEIDFQHANSIDIDSDGNYLLSNRNLSEITKIDGATSNIIWRFGGRHNQFKLVGDTLGFSCQHYAKWLKNGDILLFDNGVYHAVQESRAVEYYLDTNTMTATLKWQYRHNPPLFADVMGNAERLDNGNTFIGWGSNLAVAATEVDSIGTVVYEMDLPNTSSYRAIKYPNPAPAGVSAAQPQPGGLSFSISPTSMGYDLTVTAESSADASIALCDVAGRVLQNVYHGNISPEPRHIPLPTASLASGVYFCVLHSGQGEIMRPVLVAR